MIFLVLVQIALASSVFKPREDISFSVVHNQGELKFQATIPPNTFFAVVFKNEIYDAEIIQFNAIAPASQFEVVGIEVNNST